MKPALEQVFAGQIYDIDARFSLGEQVARVHKALNGRRNFIESRLRSSRA